MFKFTSHSYLSFELLRNCSLNYINQHNLLSPLQFNKLKVVHLT